MFGMNFNRAPKPASISGAEKVSLSTETEPEVLDALRARAQEIIAANPTMNQVLTEQDIDLAVNFLAKTQEQTGHPYTLDTLSDFEEGLPEEVASALSQRLASRGIVLPENNA